MAVQDPGNGGAHVATDDPRDRGIGELVKDLASQTSTLVRQEIKLAQAEVTEKGKVAGKGAGMLAGAAVVALLGLGELVKDLASQTSTLVRQEIKLAQAEVTEKGKIAGKGAGMLAGAAVVALLGLGALTAFLIIVLDSFLPLWAAALIVTVLWLAIAAVLGLAGKNAIQKATPPAPQTVETVKEDIQWAKTQTGSAAR
jgi:uncharacterized membrane protein YqjE